MKRDWHPEEFRKLVVLGESTAAGGWSTRPERCWASILAALINDLQAEPVVLVNSAIGGNVVSARSAHYVESGRPAALERLDKHVIAHRPDLLVIAYGLNDSRAGTPVELFAEEMTNIVRQVRLHVQPLMVLVGPYYVIDFARGAPIWSNGSLELLHQFNQATVAVAAKEDCLYADVLTASGGADWMVHYDGVHQNDLGHRVIANCIFEVLAQNCSGLARHTREIERTAPRWRDESALKADYGVVSTKAPFFP
ncbi:MAG: SGNH/GDSL hydrolase family protein [Anaerolineae bacterium]|nr:SGNH/GDSL hydrolase family protein [Anaerolineae bacterium]